MKKNLFNKRVLSMLLSTLMIASLAPGLVFADEEADLYTNDKAILYPVDFNENEGEQEALVNPAVSNTDQELQASKKVTLKYVLNDSEDAPAEPESYAAEEFAVGADANADNNIFNKTPNRPGYDFVGWCEDSERQNPVEIGEEIIMNGDRTVYAKWGRVLDLNTDYHNAYIVGYPDGTVRPQNEITRAEVITIFFRMLTEESRAQSWAITNTYSDVAGDDWFNNAVSTMQNAGIVRGYEDGTFKPDASITRAEFAVIASRFEQSGMVDVGESALNDLDNHWAQEEIKHAEALGYVKGYEDGSFKPNQRITRAEAMAVVNRVLDRNSHNIGADELLSDGTMKEWSDNMDTSAWYYTAVQEATNSHEC